MPILDQTLEATRTLRPMTAAEVKALLQLTASIELLFGIGSINILEINPTRGNDPAVSDQRARVRTAVQNQTRLQNKTSSHPAEAE